MFQVTSVGDMIEGFVDNMPEEQLDKEIKLFQSIARGLKVSRVDYASLGVIIDPDYRIETECEDYQEKLLSVVGYKPWCEKNRQSGSMFLYFETEEHAEAAAAWLERNLEEV